MAEREGLLIPVAIFASLRRTASHPLLLPQAFASQMAEREGFEPSVEFPPHILSRDAQSATLSSLLET